MKEINFRYEFLKQQIDGLEYISKYLRLKKIGIVYRSSCPFHNEKDASFTVYPPDYKIKGKEQGYTSFCCFGCGKGGDIINFKQYMNNLSTKLEACELLEKEYGLVSDEDTARHELLKQQIEHIKKNSYGKKLSISEINLVCSTLSRNYIIWVKEYFPKLYKKEEKYIDKFFKFLDEELLNYSPQFHYSNYLGLIENLKNDLNTRKKRKMNNE